MTDDRPLEPPAVREERRGPTPAVEHRLDVPRTARYMALGPQDAPDRWVVLHGYGQLARRFLRRFEPLDDGSRRIVAPEALSRFYLGHDPGRHGPGSVVGATWMTREAREDEIRDYVRYLDLITDSVFGPGYRTADATPRGGTKVRSTVLGFSQGVATAARWTTYGGHVPDRLILWGDFLPPDLDYALAARRWSETEVILVRGDDDPALENTDLRAAERRRLETAGLDLMWVRYQGGHDVDQETLVRMASSGGRGGDEPSRS